MSRFERLYIFCHICSPHSRAAQGESKDLLFLSTERYKFCVLEYDSDTGKHLAHHTSNRKCVGGDHKGFICAFFLSTAVVVQS